MKHFFLYIFITTLLSFQFTNGYGQSSTENIPEGYRLMKVYCYVCHNPEVKSHDQMLAPPMMMVKKHYKPTYPDKKDFVEAIVSWVHHPSTEKVLMPGAVRKFKIMPPLAYPEKDLIAIAEYMFDHEMDKPAMMQQMQGNKSRQEMQMEKSQVVLNDGKKWKVDASTITTMKEVNGMLTAFKGQEVSDYHQLGKDIFAKAKVMIMDENNKGEAYEQLHNFFHGMEGNMHKLMEVTTTEDGEKYRALLKVHARTFGDYFE